jgi:hypothetical protein
VQGPILRPVAAASSGGGGDPGGFLWQRLQGLRLEGLEYSFKLSSGSLLADRYLAGIHKSDIAPARLFELCETAGMPERYRAQFRKDAEDANAFHFGFEGQDTGGIYKVYIEYAHRLRPGATEPVLLHLAYKWDVNCGDRTDPSIATIARYVCHPGLDAAAIAGRLARACDTTLAEPLETLVHLAAGRTAEPLMYLEVSEEGNPRASFDLNLHAAGICIGEIGVLLAQARRHYAIASAVFDPLLEQVSARTLGHLSGGTSRAGRDFLTVYYAAGRP